MTLPGDVQIVDDVAKSFSQLIGKIFSETKSPKISFALSGGKTAQRCYKKLSLDWPWRIDWAKVDFYWGDERCVAPEDPASNQRLARESLLDEVATPGAIHPMDCTKGPQDYQELLESIGSIDVVHLGMGSDGHIASLFPDSPALDAPSEQLVAFNHDPQGNNPYKRMTLTFSGIELANLVILTIEGEGKKRAFSELQNGADLPACRIRAKNIIWLVDKEAAN